GPDGSWPIDTNLSTWVTTLAINALALSGDLERHDKPDAVRNWLVSQKFRDPHPYTGADPGAWAWTPLPGGVPDADDTPGAILALSRFPTLLEGEARQEMRKAAAWLGNLQNRDGGWPTFCRGWSKLPFDRSGTDLTAHALRALAAWRTALVTISDEPIDARTRLDARIGEAIERGFRFLIARQHADGYWVPLWFGNQYRASD